MALRPPSSMSREQLQAAMTASVRDSLRPLTTAMGIVFVILAVCSVSLGFGVWAPWLLALETASAAIAFGLRWLVGRYRVPDHLVYPMLLVIAALALVRCFGQLYVAQNPRDTMNVAILIAGTGLISLSLAWSAVIVAVAWAGWLAIAFTNPAGDEWLHFGFSLVWATALGAAVQVTRQRLQTRWLAAAAELEQHRDHLERLVEDRTRQLDASREQLRHAERLSSVGTLAAGIAHEINNPIGMILLSAEQALRMADPDSRNDALRSLLRDIVDNTKRCGRIVKNILRFARQDAAARWPDDINSVVQHAIELTQTYVARRGGVVEVELAPSLPKVKLNPVELEQVFVNLICNGVEAAEDSPHVRIRSEHVGAGVRVTVKDNGRGIPLEQRGRIFDPFYTTRHEQGGTGLGLSLAYGIVTGHGGTIRVAEAAGGGTEMIVELPGHFGESSVSSR
ncbi:MAG TPA: HAMP domain-containing sensor histidine kinase [Pirellulales bacterium]|nr:HAMP domain-containing sensor histidine kinase [Pirellulales bacterium]